MSAQRLAEWLGVLSNWLGEWFLEGPDARSKAVAKRRAKALGLGASLLIHVGLIIALLWMGLGRLVGESRADVGGGRPDAVNGQSMSFAIVSLASLDALGRTPTTTPAAEAAAGGAAAPAPLVQTPDGILPADRQVKTGDSGPAAAANDAASPSTPSSPAAAAAANGSPALTASRQGGDPDGDQNLLRQIARCLPPGSRPVIPLAKLTIELDPTGALRLAPTMSSTLPYASKDEVREADRIVQAALQCGPYRTTAPSGQPLLLVPDFSFLATKPQQQRP
jgi:hypothetical protein